MLKACYSLLLRLHPTPFRQCYEKEMLAIYEEIAADGRVPGLFIDAVVSLFRQWVLRPEFRRAASGAPIAVAGGKVPLLASLDSYTPHPGAILMGCLLSAALLSLVVTASIRPGKAPSWLIGIHKATESVLPVNRSSLKEAEPDTLVRLGEDPEDPWRAVALTYFNLMPVLKSLDANGDFVISPWEIDTAPPALRRLDLNHDGKLSPEECGFSPGPQSQGDPGFMKDSRRVFMRTHPVLAALDSDHNGEISTEEITNSSRYLRNLDSNRDGFLTPNELIPEHAAIEAADIFLRLDKDRDGRISRGEAQSEESQSLRGALLNADRNRDGATTLAELTTELRIRQESADQNERALKASSTGR
jgi:Ca2+-binding EF-hand superfamily protein